MSATKEWTFRCDNCNKSWHDRHGVFFSGKEQKRKAYIEAKMQGWWVGETDFCSEKCLHAALEKRLINGIEVVDEIK